jgi:hypothetical protein
VILAALGVAGLVLGWVLRRLGSSFGPRVSLVATAELRLAVGFVFAVTAVRAAEKGSVLFLGLAVLLAVVALASFALAAFVVWGMATYGVPDDE